MPKNPTTPKPICPPELADAIKVLRSVPRDPNYIPPPYPFSPGLEQAIRAMSMPEFRDTPKTLKAWRVLNAASERRLKRPGETDACWSRRIRRLEQRPPSAAELRAVAILDAAITATPTAR